jgi:hypothetical protein
VYADAVSSKLLPLASRWCEKESLIISRDECNSSTDYVSIHSNSTYASNLGVFDWIKGAESYFCMTEMWPRIA